MSEIHNSELCIVGAVTTYKFVTICPVGAELFMSEIHNSELCIVGAVTTYKFVTICPVGAELLCA
jgi:hypothetical protein